MASLSASLETAITEIERGIDLARCRPCGCMRETLDNLAVLLRDVDGPGTNVLRESLAGWNEQTRPVRYACLGCAHCYPAVAQNALTAAFSDGPARPGLACDFRPAPGWPAVVGEYSVLDHTGHVAVSTLGSVGLVQALAAAHPTGLAIVGKTETENIGLDKIVKNTITNASIQYLVVAGRETDGHCSGQTLVALAKNGIDAAGRVIGAAGKRPILRNVSADQVARFQQQVAVVDLIGCEDPAVIGARIEALAPKGPEPCG